MADENDVAGHGVDQSTDRGTVAVEVTQRFPGGRMAGQVECKARHTGGIERRLQRCPAPRAMPGAVDENDGSRHRAILPLSDATLDWLGKV